VRRARQANGVMAKSCGIMPTLPGMMMMGKMMGGFVMFSGESRLSDSRHRESEYASTHEVLHIVVEPSQSRRAL
jgi:hypothetical protein